MHERPDGHDGLPDPDLGAASGDAPGALPEDEVAAEVAAELEEVEERRYPSTIGGAFYLVVLAATGVGLGVVASGEWRAGVRVVAGAILAAALLRLVLRQRDAGMLAVRHRLVDCFVLVLVGCALIFLSVTIPDQPV